MIKRLPKYLIRVRKPFSTRIEYDEYPITGSLAEAIIEAKRLFESTKRITEVMQGRTRFYFQSVAEGEVIQTVELVK